MTELKTKGFVKDDEEPLLSDASDHSGKLFKSKKEVLIVIAMALAFLYGGMTFSVLAPFFAPEARKRGVSGTITGIIFAVHPFVIFILAPVLSKVVPHLGLKFCIVVGTALESASQLSFGLVGGMYSGTTFIIISFVCRIAAAVGLAFVHVAFLTLICNTFKENLATVFGINEIFTGLGLTLGPVLGGFLFKAGGFKLPFIVLGSTVLFDMLLVVFIIPNKVKLEEEEKSDVKILDVLRVPEIPLMLLTIIVLATSGAFLDPTLAGYLNKITQPEGVKSDTTGLIFLLMSLSYGLTAPFVGWVIDKKVSARRVIIVGFAIITISLLLIGPAPFLQSLWKPKVYLVIIAMVFFGIGSSMVMVPLLPVMSNSVMEAGLPDDLYTKSIVSGLFASGLYLGTAFGPALGGLLADQLGFRWTSFFFSCFVFVFILIILVFSFFEKKRMKSMKAIEDEDLQMSDVPDEKLEKKTF